MRFSTLVPWKHKSVSFNYKYPLITVLQLKEELCDMRYVIWTAISHGHIILNSRSQVPWKHKSVSFNYKYPLINVLQRKEELCDMRYVIWTAISHGHIK